MLSETGGATGSVLFRLSFEHALMRTALASTATHPPTDDRHMLLFLRKAGSPARSHSHSCRSFSLTTHRPALLLLGRHDQPLEPWIVRNASPSPVVVRVETHRRSRIRRQINRERLDGRALVAEQGPGEGA